MNIVTLEAAGYPSAIHAMRNPMDSWAKSDSRLGHIGEKDKELSLKLAAAGPEHAKHLRMIMVWADITAPRYWWTEFDTYRAGVEKVSCSTMHKLTARPLTLNDFESVDHEQEEWQKNNLLPRLNLLLKACTTTTDPYEKAYIWKKLIIELPQSYRQTRTVMMSYAALRNIYRQREGHKLTEWQYFRDWCKSLPESWMITDERD